MSEGLFVVGAPRSGTSLLRRILNTHPEIFVARETGFLNRQPALDLLGAHRALDASARRMLLKSAQWRLNLEGWDLAAVAALLEESETIEEFLPRLCALESERAEPLRYWGDNTPTYVRLSSELLGIYPSAKCIVIVRDPRAVVSSILPLEFGANHATMAAIDWVGDIAHGLAAANTHEGRVHHLRYEDLVADPGTELQSVATFLGVATDFDPDDVSGPTAALADRLEHHRELSRRIEPHLAERWRTKLSERDRLRVENETRWIARSFGYDVSVSAHDRSPVTMLGAAVQESVRWAIRRSGARGRARRAIRSRP